MRRDTEIPMPSNWWNRDKEIPRRSNRDKEIPARCKLVGMTNGIERARKNVDGRMDTTQKGRTNGSWKGAREKIPEHWQAISANKRRI